MTQINFRTREITCKVAYCGPVFSGKKTSLEFIHQTAPKAQVSTLSTVSIDGDLMTFFDYTPVGAKLETMTLKLRLCTLSGYTHYRASKRVLMENVDGLVFVADSQTKRLQENVDELEIAKDDLRAVAHLSPRMTPHVLQWNKRDLPHAMKTDELAKHLNEFDAPTFETVSTKGEGVVAALEALTSAMRKKLIVEYGLR